MEGSDGYYTSGISEEHALIRIIWMYKRTVLLKILFCVVLLSKSPKLKFIKYFISNFTAVYLCL